MVTDESLNLDGLFRGLRVASELMLENVGYEMDEILNAEVDGRNAEFFVTVNVAMVVVL